MIYKRIYKCLVCDSKKLKSYVNLGRQPLANNLSRKITFDKYPLKVNFCKNCFHNQLSIAVKKEKLFKNYLYLSSQSKTLQNHFDNSAKKYIKKFKLKKNSNIIDIGSNDGIALKSFIKFGYKKTVGIEPARNVAKIANKNGIKTINSFLNEKISQRLSSKFDLVLASNVFAHNENIKKLGENLINLLNPKGILVIEVQYLINMLEKNIYDNIYHEHIHYWSANCLNKLFRRYNSDIFKFEKIDTHGGSLRCYIKLKHNKSYKINTKKFLKMEKRKGLEDEKLYKKFSNKIKNQKINFTKFLSKNKKKNIVGYGAAAKASTLLNYFNISEPNFQIIDDNKLKQGNLIPGTKIKIVSRKSINKEIDYLIVFAWNYFKEIKKKITFAKKIISIRKFIR